MRKWNCPYCGEEMLGDVNRCWSCSKRIDPPPLEPLIIAIAEEPLVAATVGAGESLHIATSTAVLEEPEPLKMDDIAVAFAKEPPRRGSPFAAIADVSDAKPFQPQYGAGPYSQPASPTDGRRFASPPLATKYPQPDVAMGAVAIAFLLAGFSLFTLFFTVFGIFSAAIGIGCGIAGLYGQRRTVATVAVLLCALVFMLNSYFVALAIYEMVTGVSVINGGGW